MTPRELILAQLNHQQTETVPYYLSFDDGTDKELDAYYGSTEWRQKLVAYHGYIGGVDTTNEKKIDDVYIRDAFGGLWRDDRRPMHLEKPPLENASFDGYTFPKASEFPRTSCEEMKKNAELHKDRFTLIYLGWGLFEQSWRLRGFENALMDAVSEEDFYAELIKRVADMYLEHIKYFADAPADAIMFGDDWGDQRGVIVGPERWRKFFKPHWARLYEEAHRQGKIVVSHCCGSIADIMDDCIEIGLNVLESCQPEAAGMNPYSLKKRWGDKLTFWGCLGSQSTVPFGTPASIKAEVQKLCGEMGKGGGFYLAPAKAIQPGTPVENMAACFESFTNQKG